MFDTDRSGTLSMTELKKVFETSEKKEDELWNEIFTEVDLDGDGQISFEEFEIAMLKAATSSSSKHLHRTETEKTGVS